MGQFFFRTRSFAIEGRAHVESVSVAFCAFEKSEKRKDPTETLAMQAIAKLEEVFVQI